MMPKKKLLLVTILVLGLTTASAAIVHAITWGEPDTEHTNVGAMMMVLLGGARRNCSIPSMRIDSSLDPTYPHEIA